MHTEESPRIKLIVVACEKFASQSPLDDTCHTPASKDRLHTLTYVDVATLTLCEPVLTVPITDTENYDTAVSVTLYQLLHVPAFLIR